LRPLQGPYATDNHQTGRHHVAQCSDRQADSHRQLLAFGARHAGQPDELGRRIFEARVGIASLAGQVSDRTRVMITAVEGDRAELVVFRSLVLDIGIYQLSFAATDQSFSLVGDGILRIEGSGGKVGPYVCEIQPLG
jgi:hypothetical protein